MVWCCVVCRGAEARSSSGDVAAARNERLVAAIEAQMLPPVMRSVMAMKSKLK